MLVVAGEGFEPSKAKPTDLQDVARGALTRINGVDIRAQGTNRAGTYCGDHNARRRPSWRRRSNARSEATNTCGCSPAAPTGLPQPRVTDRHGRPHPRWPLPTTPRTIMKSTHRNRFRCWFRCWCCWCRCRWWLCRAGRRDHGGIRGSGESGRKVYCPSPIVASPRITSDSVNPLIVRITAATASPNALTTLAGEGGPSARNNARQSEES